MKITVIAVGTKMPDWVNTAYQAYAKRFPAQYTLTLIEIKEPTRTKNAAITQCMQKEGEMMLQAIPERSQVIALAVTGQSWSTEVLSDKLQYWQDSATDITLLIGGPDGLSQDCLNKAPIKWSLSPLTLPHPLVRVILAEQLYRAITILQGHPYHRA